MKSTSLAIVAVVLAFTAIGAGPKPGQDAAAARADFVSLFNGRDLSGWKIPPGDNGHWKVLNGTPLKSRSAGSG